MDEMNFNLDGTLLPPTENLESETLEEVTCTFDASNNQFSSGFDTEHPLPSYEELRNAGFSDYLARNISEGDCHSYSDKELYHVLYESEDPVTAYNDMMNVKAHHAINKADELINKIESSSLQANTSTHIDDISHYNDSGSTNIPKEEQELGSGGCDACRQICIYNTGKGWMSSDYGYSN